jgi:hypothetical protein
MPDPTFPNQENQPNEQPFTMGTSIDLKNLAHEISQQTKADIQEGVKAATEELEVKKNSFSKRLLSYLKSQLDRFSNAVVALIAAFTMTLIMPFLVRLEMNEEISSLTQKIEGFTEAASTSTLFQNSQFISSKTDGIEQQNSELLLAVSDLSDKVNSLPAAPQAVDLSGIDSQLQGLSVQQQSLFNGITAEHQRSLAAIQSQLEALTSESAIAAPSLPKLKSKITEQLQLGQQLTSTEANETLLRSWISETHFFIGFIELESTNLTEIKATMNKIYQQADPYKDVEDQATQTLLVLSALNKWVDLF